MGNRVLGVIPARLQSSRLPRKMLLDIAGKPLIQHTFERARAARGIDEIIIATDSEEIASVAREFGARVTLTSAEHPNGTDRVCEAVKKFTDFDPEIVVNIFGDEPFISPITIEAALQSLQEDSEAQVGTVAAIISKEEAERSSLVKIIADNNNNVLYLSRSLVPYQYNKNASVRYCHILGAMAFKKDFLFTYQTLPQSSLELAEGVEQLRIIENGYKVKVAIGDYQGIGVNTPEDLAAVRSLLSEN